MKYYSFDKDTAAYIGSGDADESPAEPGNFLLPAWATFKEPVFEEGKTAFFIAGSWELRDETSDEVKAIVVNGVAPVEDKRSIVLNWASMTLDGVAQALGFKSMDDSMTHAVDDISSQRESDAAALKAWRREMMRVTDSIVEVMANEDKALPAPQDYVNVLPPFKREVWKKADQE